MLWNRSPVAIGMSMCRATSAIASKLFGRSGSSKNIGVYFSMPRPSAIASGGVRRRWISIHRSTFGPTASRSRRTLSIASSMRAACGL